MSAVGELQYVTGPAGDIEAIPGSPPLAFSSVGFLGRFQTIVINSWGNYWNNPTQAQALVDGKPQQMNLVASLAASDGVAELSVLEYQELIILHELKHLFGGDHPGNASSAVKAYDRSIIENCLGLKVH